ncbi:hypothetical protein AQJ27_45225 [Streptomyces olivochromogenes]|nr:hypothetical protein AQJ27_45225 [Streptomyces olivochromogenes]
MASALTRREQAWPREATALTREFSALFPLTSASGWTRGACRRAGRFRPARGASTTVGLAVSIIDC